MTEVATRAVTDRAAPPSAVPAPADDRRRILAVDVVRGVALLGMIAVHSLNDVDAAGQPSWSTTVFAGRAAAAFAVIAGITIAFLTGRRRVRFAGALPAAAALLTRALVIGVIGLALGYTDAATATVILPYYAVMFLVAIPLVFLPTWLVAFAGLAAAGGMPVLTHVMLARLAQPTHPNLTFGWLFAHPAASLSELSITGAYPALTWMAYVCAGIVIGRLNLARLRTAVALLATGTVFAVAAGVTAAHLSLRALEHIWPAQFASALTEYETRDVLTLGGDGTAPTSTWWWLAIATPHTGTPLDLLGTTGTAVALLGLMLLAARIARPAGLRRLVAVVLTPLGAAGGIALTVYTLHTLFMSSDFDEYTATTGFVVQLCGALLLGLGVRATIGKGPLEALVSALTAAARRWATRPARRLQTTTTTRSEASR
ncbi:heparan-alpha-glucosaminide N-acetyltransferase domain-containing protein [Hamadaea tsunoensis]|uniref:heparan-alpha-glucosaminide N-acetyltransferase domain-containing protein n=1 Tax=Hamadaea tsunoensis TaxID=53368 RepID=UPI0004054F1A|nr:heparan-alpha-glucosaminide N-acetyltransferase domain-containing protein [Hamadaea tsunoensis]